MTQMTQMTQVTHLAITGLVAFQNCVNDLSILKQAGGAFEKLQTWDITLPASTLEDQSVVSATTCILMSVLFSSSSRGRGNKRFYEKCDESFIEATEHPTCFMM